MIANFILIVVLVIIVGGAVLYIYKSKKKGQKCIGCPYSKQCNSHKCSCDNYVNNPKKN